ncbi:MAG: hypothetical protein UU65_C0003G0060 [candidate division CPR2 bacterium GW2011_GWC1_41_48]|uniref:Uncharacterized protein n=1 Tax=candidate division CPR2 bacterium GW2011_GWC1_41_48 TaxID=1618344 RepID=A0A0G0W7R5_UNCC2|nr:MAG: hypothetical protein UT47_C0003G0066 [candidate division CPR2 bacterium GW2011_GWC2_39_35]KKR29350.1 MAG: hypothetical protein UT60_C0003G0027 [candidate division CPR2 bacterium GW2011_GWD2_39_7]KKS09005.1 MAG: hypothetical protein UU65_C0003G0060 [candidate division CPR2 bacterium GW2011_GWC1_41_48]
MIEFFNNLKGCDFMSLVLLKEKAKTPAIGIAMHRNFFTVVKDDEEIQVANDHAGLREVEKAAKKSGVSRIVFVGNKRWATPLAYSLRARGFEIFYISIKTDGNKRGPAGSVEKTLKSALNMGMSGFSFFGGLNHAKTASEHEPFIVQLAKRYLELTNEGRRIKHDILDRMVVLFPEVIKVGGSNDKPIPLPQPPIWTTKKMRHVLEDPFPESLKKSSLIPEVRKLAAKSLALDIPIDFRKGEAEKLKESLARFDEIALLKEEAHRRLRNEFDLHPAMDDFGGNTIVLLLGLLAWRRWENWRELRSYCGLAVTRMDSKGKPRISRKRGEIRQYLYLLATTSKRGKEIARNIGIAAVLTDEEKKRKLRRVKQLERLLKYLWKEYLR